MDFEQFVAEELPALVRYAAMLAGERDLAQDVVQDALIRANARWRQIGAMARPEQYVRRMITTEYLSWRRRHARRAAVLTRWAVALTPGAVVDHADNMAARSVLNQQLATLPPKQRAVLILDYYEATPTPRSPPSSAAHPAPSGCTAPAPLPPYGPTSPPRSPSGRIDENRTPCRT